MAGLKDLFKPPAKPEPISETLREAARYLGMEVPHSEGPSFRIGEGLLLQAQIIRELAKRGSRDGD